MLRLKIAKGAALMVLMKLLERSLGIVSTLVLARLLVPADFGLVAMAMSVVALIELASAFSLDVPLIQRSNPTRDHYDTAWTFNLLMGVGCGLAIALLAHPAAVFYAEPRLTLVMLALSVGWVLQGLENIGIVNFRRAMDFRRELLFLLGKKLCAFVVTVTLAFVLRSYWALVAGILTGRVAGVALSYAMEPYRPRLCLRARADLFSVSSWLFINNLLHFGTQRLSHFFLGRLNGTQALGLYAVGAELAYLPQTELVAPINRAVFPGYSRMAEEEAEMSRGFVDINAVVALFVFPACVGLAVVADLVVAVLLGPKWEDAVPVIRVLVVAGCLSALMSNTYSAYLALNRARVTTWMLTIELVVLIPAMLLFSRAFGFIGIAYAELTAVAAGVAFSYPLLFRVLRVSVARYVGNIWRPMVAAALMGVAVTALAERAKSGPEPLPAIVALSACVAAGVVIYAGTLFSLWLLSGRPQGVEKMLLRRVLPMFGWTAQHGQES